MEEGAPREAHLDERGLHTGQHPGDAPFVEIADQPPPARPLDEDLLQHAALEQRDPRLERRGVHQQLDAHAAPSQSGKPAARNNCEVSASGSPTTPEKLPSMDCTNTAPRPWMA